jgi:hypothetical protein
MERKREREKERKREREKVRKKESVRNIPVRLLCPVYDSVQLN